MRYNIYMSRNVSFAPGEFYHLYNRGTEKRNIFLSKIDYERFTSLLYLANGTVPIHIERQERQGSTSPDLYRLDRGETQVNIGAYVLMPNHFHLLIQEKEEGGISKFMQKLLTAYTMYFNRRMERNGALFQGKFKATHANGDAYLKYLISYIHLNPIKLIEPKWKEAGIKNIKDAGIYIQAYKYSSYKDFFGEERPEKNLLTKEAFPEYFNKLKDFESCTEEWLNYNL